MRIVRTALLPSALTFLLATGGVALAQDTPQGDTPQADEPQTDRPDGDREGTQERRERRGQRRGGFGGFGGMGNLDRLKEQLGLTDEQVKQFEAVQAQMREQMQKVREQMRDGTFDRDSMREQFRAARELIETKMDEILTPEQREKMREMRGAFGRQRGERGERGGRRGGREALGRRLRDEAVKALALSEEEQAVVLPLLDSVLETRRLQLEEQERRRQALLEQVRQTTDGDALQKLLTEYRASKQADEVQLAQAQTQLREVLTVEQEAKLVGLNVLQ